MKSDTIRRLKLVIRVMSVLILLFIGRKIFLGRWKIKPSEDMEAVKLRCMMNDGYYSELLITDEEKINDLSNIVLDMENKIVLSNISDIKESEKFQSDPQMSLVFEYENMSQELCVHKDIVVIFDRRSGSDHDNIYFLRLKDMDTSELLDTAYLYMNAGIDR